MKLNFICIEDSNYCNMNCPYCDYHSTSNEKLLSYDNLIQLYKFASTQGNIEVLHGFTEPLLNWSNIEKTIQLFPLPDATTVIWTNGLLLDKHIIDFCLFHNILIQVSFDGLFQADRMPDSFNYIYNLIQKYPYCLSINSVFSKEYSKEQWIENIEFLHKLPVNSRAFQYNFNGDWSYEEMNDLYQLFFQRGQKFCQDFSISPKSIIDSNSYSPHLKRLISLDVKSDGQIYDYIPTQKIPANYIGQIQDLENLQLQPLTINYYNNTLCNKCKLQFSCQQYINPKYNIEVSNQSCYRRQCLWNHIQTI